MAVRGTIVDVDVYKSVMLQYYSKETKIVDFLGSGTFFYPLEFLFHTNNLRYVVYLYI